MNERREYNNFTFIVYLHQIKCSEYLSQSINICCEKRKEIYMHIKIFLFIFLQVLRAYAV